MPKDRATDLLDAFAAVTAAAPRPESPLRRTVMRTSLPAATLAGGVLIVAIVAVAGVLAGRSSPPSDPGAAPSASAARSAPVAIASVAPSAEPSTAPTTAPTSPPTPEPTVGPCDPAVLATRVTSWEGAAGSRIANVELINHGKIDCLLEARAHPQLVDADGGVLIDGKDPATTAVLTLVPGQKVTTLVSASNYCGSDPPLPMSVAFVLGDGRRIVADPAPRADETLPPCNGPGQPGQVEMHPWAP
jgi:hypothetical protein